MVFAFALILPPPHPWHHTPRCHSPWGCAEGPNFSVGLISSTAPQLCKGVKQQLRGEAGREGSSFPKTQLQAALCVTSTWHRHCSALAGALPGLARLNGEWWWNTSLRKALMIGNSLMSFSVSICCASAARESQGRSPILLSASLALVLVRFVIAF